MGGGGVIYCMSRYLLLHCTHAVTRLKGKIVSRTIMSTTEAYQRMHALQPTTASGIPVATLADRSSAAQPLSPEDDFVGSLVAMWGSGIVPRLTESFDGIVSALFRCVQVFQLVDSGELNRQTHKRQFQLKLHSCVFLGAELLRLCFHRQGIVRSRGFMWAYPRAFSGAEFCSALVEASANPPPMAERTTRYVLCRT